VARSRYCTLTGSPKDSLGAWGFNSVSEGVLAAGRNSPTHSNRVLVNATLAFGSCSWLKSWYDRSPEASVMFVLTCHGTALGRPLAQLMSGIRGQGLEMQTTTRPGSGEPPHRFSFAIQKQPPHEPRTRHLLLLRCSRLRGSDWAVRDGCFCVQPLVSRTGPKSCRVLLPPRHEGLVRVAPCPLTGRSGPLYGRRLGRSERH
jgi:hypothetical protein